MPLPLRSAVRAKAKAALPFAPLALATLALAVVCTRAILLGTDGEPAVPLDDAFIHFQFARAWAELHPFAYTPGAAPVPGATSLLWPLCLAPFHAIGFRDTAIIWPAWILNFVALGLLAYDTRRLADRVTSREGGIAAGAMVLAFGGYVWFAGSGMEVVPFSWLLVRTARRAAEWGEPDAAGALPRSVGRARLELCLLGALTPLMRPEGVVATLLAVVALTAFPRGGSRAWALVPLLGLALFPAANLIFTGQASTTTMQAKWLPHSPYRHELWVRVRYHLDLLFNTLLDGRVWSRLFIPQGGKVIAWLAIPALLFAGFTRSCKWRAAVVLVVAGAIALPATYDTFLVNRLRYLWPFAAAWFVGLVALSDAVGFGLARWRPELRRVRTLIAGGFVGALAVQLSGSVDDLETSASAIHQQQVALGRWARTELGPESVIGVNDAGAIAYFSERSTFDIVGLTTRGEAEYWLAGAGSRFEHYERLGREHLPTHFIVYQSWFGIPALLGKYLTERTVSGATILGDSTKVAREARYTALGSAAEPILSVAGAPLDALDVADLQSERAHEYALFWATQQDNVAIEDAEGRVDGARQQRTWDRFELEIAAGGLVVGRVATDTRLELEVQIDSETVGRWRTSGSHGWEEHPLRLSTDIPTGRHVVQVRAPAGKTFTSLHYWSYRP
jgi:hypothetical protein